MSARAIAAAVAAAINLCLAIVAISRNRRSILYRTFSFTSFCLFIWNLFYVFQVNLQVKYDLIGKPLIGIPPDLAFRLYLWQRLNCVGLVFLPAAVFHFAISLTERKNRLNQYILRVAYVVSFLFLASLATPWFTSFQNVHWSRAYASFLIPLSIYSLHLVFQKYRLSESAVERNRLRYLLSGGVIGVGGGITNLASVFGIQIPPFGNITNALYALIVAFAIIRHRLLDIQVVFNRILSWLIMALSFSGIFLLFVFLVGEPLQMVYLSVLLAASIIVLIFQPFKERVQLFTSSLVLRGKYDYQKTLGDFGEAMTQMVEANKLTMLLVKTVTETMRIDGASLMLVDNRREAYKIAHSIRSGSKDTVLPSTDPLIEWLCKEGKPLVKEEVERRLRLDGPPGERRAGLAQVVEALERLGAEVAIPLLAREYLIGVLSLGAKAPDEIYTGEDIELLSLLAGQAALALENIRMWEDVRRVDRLRALGEMAASVAHEVRNPLGAIRSSAQFLQGEAKDSELPGIILEEVDRLSSLVSDFLDFSRPLEPKLKPYNIVDSIEGALDLLEKEGSLRSIKVVKSFGEELPLVLIDPYQMKQVFINLFLNATQAMPSGGTLTTGVSAQGDRLEIEVSDTGCGIEQDKLEKVFEPFFSTKERGAGLGLSIVRRIVEAHKGTIRAESSVGKGTTITISLPIGVPEKPGSPPS